VALYREQGVVLRTYRLGESGRGKVRAVAKGVRKTKSRFGSRLEPMSHVALQLYEGRQLDTVTQAESIDHFRPIRDDLDRMNRAAVLLEVVDQVVQEGEINVRAYQMLVGALRALAARDEPLIVPAFFWKLLSAEGLHPLLDVCASCGTAEDLVAFDLDQGGVLCQGCRSGLALSPGALAVMRRILGGDLASVLNQGAGDSAVEVEALATHAIEHHLERRLKALHVLDRS
jgi:DNA repair protein RecO (recombination protein O)